MRAVRGGSIRGRQRDGVWLFAGVPYARSPEGRLRWRAPVPPEPWRGIREATEFGPIAPQPLPLPGAAIAGDPRAQSEDCLSLNVWTPGLDDHRRPVMVWLHGGGFTSGCGSSQLYDGHRLARTGDVVVLTLNYRLGVLGFLGHHALAEGSATAMGNWGLLDQLAGLQWVQEHIAAFGGDPHNVTLFGESAGGMCVSALLGVPAARGLFHKAVVQSGPPYSYSLEGAERTGDELGKLLGIYPLNRSELEVVPTQALVAAAQELQQRPPEPQDLPLPFRPVIDGLLLPRPPEDTLAAGGAAGIPLLVGTNRDELTFFSLGDQRLAHIDEVGLVRWVQRTAPAVPAAESVERYRAIRRGRGEPTGPRDVWVAMGSDIVFRWPSLLMASAQRVHQPATYAYLFTWETPVFDGALGACHALEIPFVFGSFEHPAIVPFAGTGPGASELSQQMRDAWTSFARHGDPSRGGPGVWGAWDPQRRSTMIFGPEGGAVDGPRDDELAVWAAAAPLAGDEPVQGLGAG